MFNLDRDLFNVMVFCLMLLKFHSDGSENNFLRNPIKYRDLDVYRPSEERLSTLHLHTQSRRALKPILSVRER